MVKWLHSGGWSNRCHVRKSSYGTSTVMLVPFVTLFILMFYTISITSHQSLCHETCAGTYKEFIILCKSKILPAKSCKNLPLRVICTLMGCAMHILVDDCALVLYSGWQNWLLLPQFFFSEAISWREVKEVSWARTYACNLCTMFHAAWLQKLNINKRDR